MYAITFALHVNNKPLAIDQKYIERIRLTRDIDSLSCVSQMVFFFLNEHKMPCDVTRDTVVLWKKEVTFHNNEGEVKGHTRNCISLKHFL